MDYYGFDCGQKCLTGEMPEGYERCDGAVKSAAYDMRYPFIPTTYTNLRAISTNYPAHTNQLYEYT